MVRHVLKTALIGTNYVGKSCLCYAITGRIIEKEYSSTIGIDFIVKHVFRQNDTIALSLWDLSGLDRFRYIVGSYIRDSSVLIYCYSAESYDSFRKMLWKYEEYKNLGYSTNKHIIIVVTKIDSKKTFTYFETLGEEFAKKHGYPFIKTSSYNKEGIQDLINTCITIIPITIIKPPEPLIIQKYKYCNIYKCSLQ
jgi:small GTP-binding protein